MQNLEHGRRRKKRSVLSKFVASSNQSSPRCLADSLDSVGDEQTSRSDDYGHNELQGSSKLKQCVFDSKNYSPSDVDETGLDDLNNDDEDESSSQRYITNVKKTGLDNLNINDYDDDDDDDATVDSAIRWRPEPAGELKKHDLLELAAPLGAYPLTMDDLSPKLSPKQQQHQTLNGEHYVSDSEDEDALDPEEMGAMAAVAEYDKKSVPSTVAVPPINTQHSANETLSDDRSHEPESASSTLSSAVMKIYGLFTRSSQAPSECSTISSSMTKLSTKDARNRYVSYCSY